MKQESFNFGSREFWNLARMESVYIGMLLAAMLIVFKIAFFREEVLVVFRTVISLFWLFVLPGYSMMFYWREKLGFVERLVIGIALSIALVGTISYYLGLLGLHLKYQAFFLPLAFVLAGLFISLRK